jgi:hypothetical protein
MRAELDACLDAALRLERRALAPQLAHRHDEAFPRG